MPSSRKLGVVLVAAGSVLCAMWVVPTVSAAVMSRMEIDAFHTRTPKTVAWDRSRTRAYQKTLRVKVDPPEAVLTIDRLGVKVPVLDGTSEFTLNRGVGHIDGTAMPGQPGNVAITGHRDGFFRPLKDIARGDVISLEREGGTDHYIVSDMKIVSPSDTSVLAPTEKNTLTLVTCYPFHYIGPAPQRYIVTASLMTAAKQVANQAGPGI
jgi:sortase A